MQTPSAQLGRFISPAYIWVKPVLGQTNIDKNTLFLILHLSGVNVWTQIPLSQYVHIHRVVSDIFRNSSHATAWISDNEPE